MVPGQEERLVSGIPDRKGEHASQVLYTLSSFVFVQVKDYLGVTIGGKLVVVLQILSQVPVVVDFSVEDYPQRTIVVAHRLVTATQVNNRQAPVAQADEFIKVGSIVIGAPML